MNKFMKILISITSMVVLVISLNLFGKDNNQSYIPPNGFIPNEETAARVAEAILIPIYGKERIQKQKPLKAKLNSNEVWEITGTLNKSMIGGTVYAEIRKSDCKVIYVTHYK